MSWNLVVAGRRNVDNHKYAHFLKIAHQLNALGITPCLMGSLGMKLRTHQDWDPKDIDIHVPGDARGWDAPCEQIDRWYEIKDMMFELGYALIDLHEHAFSKDDVHIEIGNISTLKSFAGVNIKDLPMVTEEASTFYLPNEKQFLLIYQASLKDSYRQDHNNHKDLAKITYLAS